MYHLLIAAYVATRPAYQYAAHQGARRVQPRFFNVSEGGQGVRAMSSSAKSVKAPAQTFGVSGRYASALWQHANTVGALDKVWFRCDWCKLCCVECGGIS